MVSERLNVSLRGFFGWVSPVPFLRPVIDRDSQGVAAGFLGLPPSGGPVGMTLWWSRRLLGCRLFVMKRIFFLRCFCATRVLLAAAFASGGGNDSDKAGIAAASGEGLGSWEKRSSFSSRPYFPFRCLGLS